MSDTLRTFDVALTWSNDDAAHALMLERLAEVKEAADAANASLDRLRHIDFKVSSETLSEIEAFKQMHGCKTNTEALRLLIKQTQQA